MEVRGYRRRPPNKSSFLRCTDDYYRIALDRAIIDQDTGALGSKESIPILESLMYLLTAHVDCFTKRCNLDHFIASVAMFIYEQPPQPEDGPVYRIRAALQFYLCLLFTEWHFRLHHPKVRPRTAIRVLAFRHERRTGHYDDMVAINRANWIKSLQVSCLDRAKLRKRRKFKTLHDSNIYYLQRVAIASNIESDFRLVEDILRLSCHRVAESSWVFRDPSHMKFKAEPFAIVRKARARMELVCQRILLNRVRYEKNQTPIPSPEINDEWLTNETDVMNLAPMPPMSCEDERLHIGALKRKRETSEPTDEELAT